MSMNGYLYFSPVKLFLTLAKIIYFSAQIFAGREFDGTGRSTVYVERYGTEYAI